LNEVGEEGRWRAQNSEGERERERKRESEGRGESGGRSELLSTKDLSRARRESRERVL